MSLGYTIVYHKSFDLAHPEISTHFSPALNSHRRCGSFLPSFYTDLSRLVSLTKWPYPNMHFGPSCRKTIKNRLPGMLEQVLVPHGTF